MFEHVHDEYGDDQTNQISSKSGVEIQFGILLPAENRQKTCLSFVHIELKDMIRMFHVSKIK